MRKRISLVLAITILTMLLTACKITKTTNLDKDLWNKFTVVEDYENFSTGHLYIVYDKNTKVMYYIIDSDYKIGITPIYNADGTVKVYENKE